MKDLLAQFRLLTLGVMPRLGIAVSVIALLWLGFFLATAPIGA